MGKIKQGILGGFSGKVANVVGSSWKGIAVMKSLPLSVANPRTAAQVAQRTKFTNVTLFASSILADIIKPLWDRFAQEMSGFNDFVRTNIDLFTTAVPSTYADLVISKGKMAAVNPSSITLVDSNKHVGFHYSEFAVGAFELETDICYLVFYNETQDEWGSKMTTSPRGDGESSFQLVNDPATDDVIHLWIAFRRADGTVISDTGYITADVPA